MSLVTVIIPYYNDEKFIRKSVESVLNQSLKDLQLILVNHATTDSSRDIVHSYEDDRIFHIDAEKNAGAGTSLLLNMAKPHITGKYVKFLCADDELKPDCLEKFVKFSDENNLDFCFSDADYIDENSKSLGNSWSKEYHVFNPNTTRNEFISWYFKDFNFLPWVGLFLKTTALASVDLNYTLIFSVDKFICLDMLIAGLNFKILTEALVNYRIHDGQIVSKGSGKESKKKEYEISVLNSFEKLLIPGKFYGIKDFDLLKYLCSDVDYCAKLTAEDTLLFPVLLDIHFMQSDSISLVHSAYLHLQDLFQNDEMRNVMERKIGFTIKEFRALYREAGIRNSITEKYGIKFISKYLFLRILGRLFHKVFIYF